MAVSADLSHRFEAESVGRALQTMRKLGWIETRRRAIRVLDPVALEGATA